MNGVVSDAAIEALGVVRDVVDDLRTDRLGDRAVLMRYAQHRGNPQAILAFTARHLGPDASQDEMASEATRYESAMEDLWRKQIGGV